MADPKLLAPVIALVVWTHLMWVWMYVTRLPAVRRAHMRLDPFAQRGAQMGELPARIRWKADNYNHLMEHPTVFYATVLVLALLPASPAAAPLAWSYVGLRAVHSVVQATWNKIEVRFVLFTLSVLVNVALLALAVVAL